MGTKLRMGMHNPITAERFKIIKAAILGGMSEEEVMRRYEIKRTTLKYIKRSMTFYEYRLWTETLPAARKMAPVIEPNSGVAFEDYVRPKHSSKVEIPQSNGSDSNIAKIAIVAIVGVVALVAFYLIGGRP